MKAIKFSVAALFAAGLLAMMLPGATFAKSKKHGPKTHQVFGTLCTYTAGTSASIAPAGTTCGSSTDVTFALRKGTRLVDEDGTTNPPVVNDAAQATLVRAKKHPTAIRLQFGALAFVVNRGQFQGTFNTFTGDCTAGTLTINGVRKKDAGMTLTFNTDGTTQYRLKGSTTDCATAQGSYATSGRIGIRAVEMTDATWTARVVNVVVAKTPPSTT